MKLRPLIAIFAIGTLFFVGCVQTQEGTPEEGQPEAAVEEDEGLDTRIYGTWNRTATYTDGVSVATDPASTIFNEDGLYISIGTCTVNGAYMVVDDILTCTIDSHDCQGFTGPYSYNSTFRISEDGEGLTLDTQMSGHLVTETFVRATD